MNYYEELDLPPNASVEEIRRAYRALACLLHPDPQRQARQRRLAELQMTRLNGILAVLSDAGRRREYDLGLRAPGLSRHRRRGRWLGALAPAGLAALAWYCIPLPVRGPVVSIPAPAPPPLASAPSAVRRLPPVARRTQPATRRGARRPDWPERRRQAENPPAGTRLAAATADSTAPPAPNQPLAAAPPPPASFAGVWVYAPAGAPRTSARLYQPEYIEMRLVERQGLLTGSYTGRYRVTDPRILPAVAFAVEGRARGARAELRWYGAGGASGSMLLHLLGDTAVKVTWTVDEMGPQPILASGVATLLRWREP